MEDDRETEADSCNTLTSLNETTMILGRLFYSIFFLFVQNFALKYLLHIRASCRQYLVITSKKYACLIYSQFSVAPLCSLVKTFVLCTFVYPIIFETIFQIQHGHFKESL